MRGKVQPKSRFQLRREDLRIRFCRLLDSESIVAPEN